MNQKTIAIVAIVIVAVAVIGVVAYWALTRPPSETPPTGIADATSLKFNVDIIGGNANGTYRYMSKNIGTSDMMIRVEIPTPGVELVYIVNGAQQKAWSYEGAGWNDLSSTFSTQWDAWESTYSGYTDRLTTWTSGDWTYTGDDGSSVRVYDITVNPTLDDSLFAPP